MSVDKLVDSTQLDADLTSVANAIRTKGGTSASLAFPSGFVSAINAISTGGGGTTFTKLASAKIKNGRSSALQTTRVCCDSYSTGFGLGAYYYQINAGATSTMSFAFFNNDYIVFHANAQLTSITYDGNALTFESSNSGSQYDYHVHIPSNYSNTIPIILS